jgi:mannose-6-phosphate isomerase-like protein (cupin superfamily)
LKTQNHFQQITPIRIPVPGDKLIEEHFGLASTGHKSFSLAHMVAPPHWGEPAQRPEFDEITIMIKGRMHIRLEDKEVVLEAGQSFWVKGGEQVQYSNPFDEPSEYWAVCMPAFSIDTVHREED